MSWRCGAIENGVVLYQDNTISPCCLIHHSYRKDVKDINNDPFSDIRTGEPPSVCETCHNAERLTGNSYRKQFPLLNHNKYAYLDIRNSNLCNMKCRICCPDNSNLWAEELNFKFTLLHADISPYINHLLTENVKDIYYTGGEPLLNKEHWAIIDHLIDNGYSKNISLRYNTNGSVTKHKNINIKEKWKKFKSVTLMLSIDAVGEEFNILRHGGDWKKIRENIETFKQWENVNVAITPAVSNLNIWFLKDLLVEFSKFDVNLTNVDYPDYLSLSALPDKLRDQALEQLDKISKIYKKDLSIFRDKLVNNNLKYLFRDTMLHTLLLDKKRKENLFDKLPFSEYQKAFLLNKKID